MALTKVTGHVVKPDTNIQFHNTKSTGIVTFAHTDNATSSTTGALQITGGVGIVKDLHVGGNITVGGTLTYDDVTNIDSLGIITAREGIFLPNDKQVKLGNTAASPDFKIYHNTVANTTSPPNYLYPNSNYIDSVASQNLFIRTSTAGIYLGRTDGAHAASFHTNGSVVLYQNASGGGGEKFRTKDYGINVTGTTDTDGLIVSGIATATTELNVGTGGTAFTSLNTGLVGIGTDNPGVPLQMNHASPKILLKDTDNNADISLHNVGGAMVFASAGVMTFATQGGSEDLRIDASGRLLIGHTDTDNRDGFNSALQVTGTSGDDTSITIGRWTAGVQPPHLVFSKSRNGTIGSHTAVQTGDELGSIQFLGDDGTRYLQGAHIKAEASTPIADYDMATDLVFGTNYGTTSPSRRMTIKHDGKIGIGTGIPENLLHVKGSNTVARFESTTSYVDLKLENSSSHLGFIQYNGTELRFFANSGSTPTVYIPSGKLGVNRSPDTTINAQDTLPEIRLVCTDNNLDQGDIIGKLAFHTTDPTTPTGAGSVSHIEAFSANGNGADYTTSIFNRAGSGGGETMIRMGNALGQIRFYTHPSGGATEKLRITSSGRIEIGDIANGTGVFGSAPIEVKVSSTSGWSDYPEHISLVDQKAFGSADNGSGIVFSGKYNTAGNATTFGSIHAKKATTADGNYGGILTFNTREHGNSNFERMRIDSTGRVFINSVGATTPTADYRSLNLVAHAHSEAGVSFSRSSSTMGSGSTAGRSIIMHSDGTLYVSTHNVAEDLRITNQGKVGINYAGTPPDETVMIRPSRDQTLSRVTLSHLSSGNSYGARISTISGNSLGFDLATQFNSSYVTRARMTGTGIFQLSTSNDISSAGTSFALNIATAQSGTYNAYSGIALKSLETGGGNGMCIHTTSANWDLYTRAGNQSGLNIGHSNVASSSHSRMYITEAGETCVGTDVYARLSSARKAHTIFHVTGGGLSIGPYGDTSSTREGGRYVLGWYMKTQTTSHSYVHLELNLWGGANPPGNTEYIMGGFHIHGHQYSGSGVSEERIYFHNWGGNLHGHSRHHTGTWDPGNNVYVNSAGWVTLRLLAGSYRGYVIDLVQHAWYNVRDITIRSYQTSNSSSI